MLYHWRLANEFIRNNMTGKLDWTEIEDMFTLGGYEISAGLSNSSALLALIALSRIQRSFEWVDYSESDDIEAAIALAICELTTGISGGGDMIKIAEEVAIEDVASLTIDSFDAGTFYSYLLHIHGLKTDSAVAHIDHVNMQLNGKTANNDYDSFGYIMEKGVYLDYENIQAYPGIPLVWAASTTLSYAPGIGDCQVVFADPQGDDFMRCSYTATSFANTAVKNVMTRGNGVCMYAGPLTSVKISPNDGSLFKIDPANASYPSELRMSLYGLQ